MEWKLNSKAANLLLHLYCVLKANKKNEILNVILTSKPQYNLMSVKPTFIIEWTKKNAANATKCINSMKYRHEFISNTMKRTWILTIMNEKRRGRIFCIHIFVLLNVIASIYWEAKHSCVKSNVFSTFDVQLPYWTKSLDCDRKKYV